MNPLDEDMTAFVRHRLEKAEEAYKSLSIPNSLAGEAKVTIVICLTLLRKTSTWYYCPLARF